MHQKAMNANPGQGHLLSGKEGGTRQAKMQAKSISANPQRTKSPKDGSQLANPDLHVGPARSPRVSFGSLECDHSLTSS